MNENIGKVVREMRQLNQVTQEQLAEKSGLSVNFISRIERSTNQNVSLKNLELIATALGSSTVELLSWNHRDSQDKDYPYLDKLISKLKGMNSSKAEELCKNFINIVDLTE